MRHRASCPAGLLVAGALLLCARPLAAQRKSDEMERPLVKKVNVRGVESVDEDELRQSISTRGSGCRSLLVSFLCAINDWDAVYEHEYLDRQELRKDVLRIKVFYWKRGFRETEVDTTVVPRPGKDAEVRVTFRVTEGAPTLVERVEVLRPATLLPDRVMRRLVLVRAGEPFDTYKLDTSLTRLRQAMWQRGFADAEIVQRTGVDTATRRAVVAIGVEAGPQSVVGDINVSGAEKVSVEAIRNSLRFKQGDVFRLDDMLQSQRALYESGLFRRAALFIAPVGGRPVCEVFASGLLGDVGNDADSTARPDSVKRIEVCVEEGPQREARASSGFNTVEFFQVEGRFSHLNFLGGARRLDLTGAVGNLLADQLNGRDPFRNVKVGEDERARYFAPTYQASATVSQRWFYDPRNTISAGLFASRRSSPGIFVDEGYGTTATFTRLFAERAPVSASYRFEITSVDAGDVYFCVNYGVCDRGTIDALKGGHRMSPFTLTGSIDRSSDPFEPVTGYRLRTDAEHASQLTLSDYRYNRASAEYSVYRRLFRTGTLASRVRAGWVRALASTASATDASSAENGEILHPRRRFYAGGSQSVRGFGENQLGPRVLTIPAATLLRNPACTATAIEACNPNFFTDTAGQQVDFSANDFIPRPLGGNVLAEANVELRVPILRELTKGNLLGAVFVDAGWLRGRTLGGGSRADGAITPGFGVRYRSPVGPIRVDVGLNPSRQDSLQVITEQVTIVGTDTTKSLVQLRQQRAYGAVTSSTFLGQLFQRLTLHLSIGEAF
jgi:outer membrane protein assembly factor BamA